MAASDLAVIDAPTEEDLSRCVHCGLCLNACPTYRELRVEMDSPRGRIYQMTQVHHGAPIGDSYREHIDLCLACRGCETACPSGVQYGRLVEAARAEIEQRTGYETRDTELGGQKIRINAIAPGPIDTEANRITTPKEMVDDIVKGLPLSRMGTPEDVVGMCLFLLSDEASWITGQIFNVDGGQVIRS